LHYAHKKGVLHLDLAPGKIHLTPDSTAKVRDFAITHVLMKHLPRPIVRWGVPIYLSPEQIQNKACDERSDIFSLGIILYEFLTYLHPFHDPNGNKALDNIVMETQFPTFEQFSELPPGIWTILKTCMARDPNDRYCSMEDLAKAGRELLTSISEDKRLMLAELYAALNPLRKVAAQPGASENILRLLDEIEKLAKGENEVHYAHLDRMMTELIEQYPAIQAAADASGFIDTPCFSEPINIQATTGASAREIARTGRSSARKEIRPGNRLLRVRRLRS
jgi:serine/threonine protein kinase